MVDVNYPDRSATTILAGGRRGNSLGLGIWLSGFEFPFNQGCLASAARQAEG
jgi:hypothetical protein